MLQSLTCPVVLVALHLVTPYQTYHTLNPSLGRQPGEQKTIIMKIGYLSMKIQRYTYLTRLSTFRETFKKVKSRISFSQVQTIFAKRITLCYKIKLTYITSTNYFLYPTMFSSLLSGITLKNYSTRVNKYYSIVKKDVCQLSRRRQLRCPQSVRTYY